MYYNINIISTAQAPPLPFCNVTFIKKITFELPETQTGIGTYRVILFCRVYGCS